MSCKHIDQCGGPKSKQVHSFVAVRSCSHDATGSWSVQVLSLCLTADVAEGHIPWCLIVVVDHPGQVELWNALVLVLQGEAGLVVGRTGSTVVEAVWVNGDLGVVGWINRINEVTAWGWRRQNEWIIVCKLNTYCTSSKRTYYGTRSRLFLYYYEALRPKVQILHTYLDKRMMWNAHEHNVILKCDSP